MTEGEHKLVPLTEELKREIQATLDDAEYRRVMNAQRADPELQRIERMERRHPEPDDSYDWDDLTRKRVRGRRLEEGGP